MKYDGTSAPFDVNESIGCENTLPGVFGISDGNFSPQQEKDFAPVIVRTLRHFVELHSSPTLAAVGVGVVLVANFCVIREYSVYCTQHTSEVSYVFHNFFDVADTRPVVGSPEELLHVIDIAPQIYTCTWLYYRSHAHHFLSVQTIAILAYVIILLSYTSRARNSNMRKPRARMKYNHFNRTKSTCMYCSFGDTSYNTYTGQSTTKEYTLTSTMQFDPKTVGYAERRLRVRNNGHDYTYPDELDVEVYEGLPSPYDGPSPVRSVRPLRDDSKPAAKLVHAAGEKPDKEQSDDERVSCEIVEAFLAGMFELGFTGSEEARRKYEYYSVLILVAIQYERSRKSQLVEIGSMDAHRLIDPTCDVDDLLHASGDDDFGNHRIDFED